MTLYNAELDKAVQKVKEEQAKVVCVQLPDGMKPRAKEIHDLIVKETSAKVLIWLGSNFGACDMPLGLERLNVDLVISWGHNKFRKGDGW